MPSKVLGLKSETTSLGTTVVLSSRDRSYNIKVAEYLDTDPLKNNKAKLKGGYLFRSPAIETDCWKSMLTMLSSIDGNFSITAKVVVESNKDPVVTAWARFENQSDAAMFAWSNVDKWQKWSDAAEEQDRADAKIKPTKLPVTKDGRITGTVTVTTLGK